MAWIIEVDNPFEPFRVRKSQVANGTTIREWVDAKFPETKEFPVATVCIVNGDPLLRKEWDRVISANDVVNFITMPGFFTLIIIAILLVIASIAMALLMPVPGTELGAPESDPVFSTKGQSNAIRLGEPIEVCYGRNRIYPSYASRPYFEYKDNDQFQFSLFCLGQGYYNITTIQIGDTPIDDYQEVEYAVYNPGQTVTLFPINVYTAPEAGGQELLAPNEEDYVAPGWVGPFPANPSATLASTLQLDLNYRRGLYLVKSKGGLVALSIVVEVQKRLIDNAGAPLGGWTNFFTGGPTLTFSAATTTPQRKTFHVTVTPGRYEVRMRRTDTKNISERAGHEVVWEALRSYIDDTQDFGDVTLLAVKIRATNNLNERTQKQFNIIATRKIPIWESGGFTAPQTSRSIVWAMVDIFRGLYGGRIDDEIYYDIDALVALDTLYTSRSEYFDWNFRDATTVWEAAKIVAQVGRALPLLAGSLVTMKRDGPLTVPVAMFNQDNILQNSFQWDIKLWDLDEFDSLRLEYTDPDTGYKQEQVIAVLPGDTTDHPKDIRLMGIQSRTHAYRTGMYMLATMRYLRENITFDTGLEGFMPTFGDLVAISHDVPRWGQAGYVVHAERGSGDAYHIWLSEPVSFDESSDYQVAFRTRNGDITGPFTARETDNTKQIEITSVADIDFLLGGRNEPMLFVFGVSGAYSKLMKVVRVDPQGGEVVRISCVNESSTIHSFDSLTPVALNSYPYAPEPPDLPTIDDLVIAQIDGTLTIIQVSWLAAFGAQYYIVQTSEDGVTWQERGVITRTSIQMQVRPGDLYVRVAAVNNGQGAWYQETIAIQVLNSLENDVPWDDLEWGIRWWQVLNVTSYLIKVYDNSESAPILKRTVTQTTKTYLYDWNDAVEDANLNRDMLVTVDTVFEEGAEGAPVELELHNDIPQPPTGLTSAVTTEDSDSTTLYYLLTWQVPYEADLIRIKIWLETVNGFNPAVETPILIETASSPGHQNLPESYVAGVELDSATAHPILYWRVAVFDVWGNEYSTNVSAQATIPAHA